MNSPRVFLVQGGAVVTCLAAGFYPEHLYAFLAVILPALVAAGWLYQGSLQNSKKIVR